MGSYADMPKGVTPVRDRKEARRAMNVLRSLRGRLTSQDVETIDVDLEKQSPVTNGRVICFSMYAGKDVDFGNGPKLWVDTLDGVSVEDFADYFQDPQQRFTAHNWGFDYHQFRRGGVSIHRESLASDTMHMARLENADRQGHYPYSLESLTEKELGDRKVPMDELFGKRAIKKDGTEGKQVVIPPLDEIQRGAATRQAWINYSTGDTRRQLLLERHFRKLLSSMKWRKNTTLLDYYEQRWRPFIYTLVMLEQRGIYVNTEYLAAVQPEAERVRDDSEARFKRWAATQTPQAAFMNPGSDQQLQVFFFGGSLNMSRHKPEEAVWANKAPKNGPNVGRIVPGVLPSIWTFEVPNLDGWIDPNSRYKKPKVKRPMTLLSLGFQPDHDEQTDSGWPKVGGKILDRYAGEPDVAVCAECKQRVKGYACEKHPQAKLEHKLGRAAKYFKKRAAKLEACKAIQALAESGRVATMLTGFIKPLQHLTDKRGRVHTSINLNTISGRISSKRPNLTNQPAAAKDRFGIRDAFEPEPLTSRERRAIKRELAERLGRRPTKAELREEYYQNERVFIVSDFSNLELRVAAHITACVSLIEAFEAGGDIHSRTAVEMFSYIKEAVDRGDVLIDWNEEDGPAPKPTVKQAFPYERNTGKVFNFSILYGKTVYGLSKDLQLTEREAQNKIDLWFDARPEIKMWIQRTVQEGYRLGYTKTLDGRRIQLPELKSGSKAVRRHGERKAVNGPIQGGAADIVVAAMNRIEACAKLKKWKARTLLQIHDELIMEVPRKNAVKAQKLKVHYMSHPFGDDKKLRVELKVSSAIEMTWMLAK